jgi:hypothetical protein
MDAIVFINRYQQFLNEIELVVKFELLPILESMKKIDPHDLVKPEGYFESENHARGFVWSMFIKKALYNSDFILL